MLLCWQAGKLLPSSAQLNGGGNKKVAQLKRDNKKVAHLNGGGNKKVALLNGGGKKVANPVVLEVSSRLKHVNAWIIWCDPNVSNVTTLSCRLKGAANWAKNCVDTTFKLYPFTIYPCYLCP